MASERGILERLRNWAFGERSAGAASFDDVLTAELEEIEQSRRQRGQNPLATDTPNPVRRARDSELMGLALSGGGIRSATFCLGVIQALAAADFLRRFDYLSTVSGGGFIGGWLTAWIKRSKDGVLHVQRMLTQAVSGGKAPPIDFLRDYSNYLAPRTGLFSTDTWTIGSVWLRNTVLNQAVIILFFAGCMLVPRLLGLLLPWVARFPLPNWIPYREYAPALPGIAAAVLLLVAAGRIARNLLWFEQPEDSKARKDFQPGVIRIGLMLLAACWLGAASLWQAIDHPVTPWAVAIVFAAGVFYLGRKSGFESCFRNVVADDKSHSWVSALLMTALGSGLAAFGLMQAARTIFGLWREGPSAGWHLVVWGGPFLLFLMTTVAVVQIGLLGRWLPDDRREWWSRLGAWLAILMTGCIALACISIYGPLWMAQLFVSAPGWSKGVTLGWIVTTLAGVLSGRSARSGGQVSTGKTTSNPAIEWITRVAPYVAIPGILLAVSTLLNLVLAAGLCHGYPSKPYPPAAISTATNRLDLKGELLVGDAKIRLSIPVDGVVKEGPAPAPRVGACIECVCTYKYGLLPGWRFLRDQHWNLLGPMYFSTDPPPWGGETGHWKVAWIALIAIIVATSFLAWRIDVNEFSLHHFYKNRLVRCYLGATNPNRDKEVNPFTGFALNDDMPMATFRAGAETADPSAQTYVGPYLIINGTLNFTHGERLAWQERKAASFVFSPRYCGFDGASLGLETDPPADLEANAYRKTDVYAYPNPSGIGGIHLGTAMAISGAAASPNMGYHTSAPVAFLLTLFDVRLGWWLGNPRHVRKWKRSGPVVGLLYLINELFGSATAASDYVYISDGGHFENLAIYELVRRKCRLIVACDSEEDRDFTFEGLGNAIRKCRNDFGVDIDIDLRTILDRDDQGRTSAHVLIGHIDYHDDREKGILLYLKSSLIKPAVHKEPADILEYAMHATEFPHQSTADQFFDESQFESYRRLGLHIGEVAIETIQANYGT
jgi:hypothetical protein